MPLLSEPAGRHRRPASPFRRVAGLLAGVLALAVGLAYVLPAAAAGELPVPVRVLREGTVMAATGPGGATYPFRGNGLTPTLDAYGFVSGECTSFVAWWLNSRGVPFGVVTVGPGGTGRFLNAGGWDAAAASAGFASGDVPVVGAVAQWHAGETSDRVEDGELHRTRAGTEGHVAVVVRVLADGQAEWLEFGWHGEAVLHRGFGSAPRYLYLGVAPP